MLPMSELREIPDELANRMMVSHGSAALLRALRGEPEEEIAASTLAQRIAFRKPLHTPVSLRPEVLIPQPVREIIEAVAEQFRISFEEMRGKGKRREYVLARAVAIKLIRERTWETGEPRHSFPTIGRFFNRDHSTICHAAENYETYARQFPEIEQVYQALRGDE